MKVIGVQVGGTFTDLVLLRSETCEQYVHRLPSTPESQDRAVTKGLTGILEAHQINSSVIF